MAERGFILERSWRPSWREFIRFIGRGRGGALVAIGAIIVAGGIAGSIYRPPIFDGGTPPEEGTANLWIDTNGTGTCTRSGTLVDFNDATSCQDFNEAYIAASLGDIVNVRTGSYSSQTINNHAPKNTGGVDSHVLIQEEPGATVTVAGVTINAADHLTVKGMTDSHSPQEVWNIEAANDITFDDVDISNYYTNNSDNVTVKNSDLGPCLVTIPQVVDCSNNKIDVESGANFLVENNYLHDIRIDYPGSCDPPGLCHLECQIVFGGENITFRYNTFEDCEYYDIFLQHPTWSVGPVAPFPRNITIENNFFDAIWSDGSQGDRETGIGFSARENAFVNVLVRFNSFHASAEIITNDDHDDTAYTNFRIIGNIHNQTDCEPSSGATYAYNVAIGSGTTTCGTGDTIQTAASVYTNTNFLGSGGNYHLKTGTNPAVDMVTPTSSDYLLMDDFDGDTRPAGSARDAGADER